MQECYHDEIAFSDPVFLDLKGRKAKAMWHMLAESARNFSITYSSITANQDKGTCHWEAFYDFSKTGKRVHNIIDANFVFKDGKIVVHKDYFDLWRWSRMALGIPGILLGWTPPIQQKIRATALTSLEKFISQHPEYKG